MKYIPGIILLLFFITNSGCRILKSSTFGYDKAEAKDTITALDQQSTSKVVVLKGGNGKLYYAKNVSDPGNVADSGQGDSPLLLAPLATNPVNEKYRDGEPGGVREEAKTTFATGSYKRITMRKLFNSLPSLEDMEIFQLGIKSPRVAPEKRNVFIARAYLYIVKHEDNDNDYHFIFGDKADYTKANYILNGEISALPVHFEKDAQRIKDVRQSAIDFFSTIKHCGSTNYILSIPIQIKGSLFFDFFHRNHTAKCKAVQSTTAWEIHPVYDIRFN